MEGGEPDESQAEPEFDDVEIDGKTYRVPKELVSHVMKNADYTQKTQAHAEERRNWEARVAEQRASLEREAEVFNAVQAEEAQRVAIEGRIQALRNVNVNQLSPNDQLRYNNEIMQLQWAHNDLVQTIEGRKAELEAEREQQFANLWSQTTEALNRPDEKLGWLGRYDEATQTSLVQFLQDAGVGDVKRIRATLAEPLGAKIVNLAKIGLATVKKQQQALNSKPKQPDARPVPTVNGGKAKGAVDVDKLPIDQWVKYERQRMAKARG